MNTQMRRWTVTRCTQHWIKRYRGLWWNK